MATWLYVQFWDHALCFSKTQGAVSAKTGRLVWPKRRIKIRLREEGRDPKIQGLVGCSAELESILGRGVM